MMVEETFASDVVDAGMIEYYMERPYELGLDYHNIPDSQQNYLVTAQSLQEYTKRIGKVIDDDIRNQVSYLESKHDKRLDSHDDRIDRLRDMTYDNRIMFILGIVISFILSLAIMAVVLEYEIKPEIVEQIRMEILAEEARHEDNGQ